MLLLQSQTLPLCESKDFSRLSLSDCWDHGLDSAVLSSYRFIFIDTTCHALRSARDPTLLSSLASAGAALARGFAEAGRVDLSSPLELLFRRSGSHVSSTTGSCWRITGQLHQCLKSPPEMLGSRSGGVFGLFDFTEEGKEGGKLSA